MRSEMSDRPVSLAAVLDCVRTCLGDSPERSTLIEDIRELPTFAPATPDAQDEPDAIFTRAADYLDRLAIGYEAKADRSAAQALLIAAAFVRSGNVDRRKIVIDTPATPDAPKSVEEMAAEMGLTVADLALNMYRDASGRYIRGSDIARLYAEHTAPTKPPREMPAPKVGMVAVYDDTGEVLIQSTSNGAPFTDPRHIVRICWPGPTPVVIWEREVPRG